MPSFAQHFQNTFFVCHGQHCLRLRKLNLESAVAGVLGPVSAKAFKMNTTLWPVPAHVLDGVHQALRSATINVRLTWFF